EGDSFSACEIPDADIAVHAASGEIAIIPGKAGGPDTAGVAVDEFGRVRCCGGENRNAIGVPVLGPAGKEGSVGGEFEKAPVVGESAENGYGAGAFLA